jgi:hypothetical protein
MAVTAHEPVSRWVGRTTLPVLCAIMMCASTCTTTFAASKDLGGGFRDHGVAVPISNHRGTVATVDGNGRNVLLVLLSDHRGGYALLMIDALTGKAEQFPIPFSNTMEDYPYSSILSRANRFYTHFADYFVEFDPVKRAFTFCSKTTPQMSMGMTEDDNGVIWSVSYPQSGVVSFNPKTREFRDYGEVYRQNWPQYQRYVAADDAGWLYFAVGETASQIVAFDPVTSTATPMLKDEERRPTATAYLYRDMDGKVYGQTCRDPGFDWYEFHKGVGKKIGKHDSTHAKPVITGSQALFHGIFPDGARVKTFSLVDRQLIVEDPRTSSIVESKFEYTSEGAVVMSVATAPNNTICGGTAFPMRFFCLDPTSDTLINRPAYGQWNTVTRQDDRFFVGGYPGGFMLEWDPSKPWVNTEAKKPGCNPLFLTQYEHTYRPHHLLALQDGTMVIMGGTPEYGATGGGLLFWDRQKRSAVELKDTDIIPNQSTMSQVCVPDGKLVGGTTTEAGTGGEKKAKEAEIYIMDLASKKVEWHAAVFPGVQGYTDMCIGPGGLIYGFADRKLFFVFDPAKRAVVHQKDVEAEFGLTASQQGPRVFVRGEKDQIYVLFANGIASLSPKDYKLSFVTKSPVMIGSGGDYLNGRIYFATGSHIYSCTLGGPGK